MKSSAKTAIEFAINIGERLITAKDNVENFSEWVEQTHTFKYPQATRYIRIATHKEQARQISSDSEGVSVKLLSEKLPKTKDAPIETEADPEQLAYAGSKPGAKARNSDDWHTPAPYIESARAVMGSIDLDPFTSVQANETVKAEHILTEADDALEADWMQFGAETVWMNPPYSAGNSTKAINKFIDEYSHGAFKQGIVLMNNSTDTAWFHNLAADDVAVCFTKGRISFVDAGGKVSSSNTRGQVFFYFGDNVAEFERVFSAYGRVFYTGGAA